MTLTFCMVINSWIRHNMESLSASPYQLMMTSWPGLAFRSNGLLWGQTTGQRWISFTKCQTCELCFLLWCQLEHAFVQTVELPMGWHAMTVMWHRSKWKSSPSDGTSDLQWVEYYLGITSSQFTVLNLILFTSWWKGHIWIVQKCSVRLFEIVKFWRMS